MAQSVNLQQLVSLNDDDTGNADLIYNFVIWWRIAVMTISSGLLIVNIVMIVKSKQYIYNTLKLFLFLELFTVVGQIVVLIHTLTFPTFDKYYFQSPTTIDQIIDMIIDPNPAKIIPCSLEAYINMFCYNISYFFALLITLYVRRVIDNTHKYFMRRHYKLIIYVVLGTLLVYLPPFVLSFFKDVPYSFGPVGFEIRDEIFSGKIRNYLFYCGITSRTPDDFWSNFLSVFNMTLIPVLMFIIHFILLQKNRKSMKFLKGLEQLNPRQWFILKSGTLSVFVFIFQTLNFVKYILSLFNTEENSNFSTFIILIVGIFNMVFDFLPIILVFLYYKKYYRKGKKLQEKSLVRTTNTESFDTHQIINF